MVSIRKTAAALTATAVLTGGLTVGVISPAEAACRGQNSRVLGGVDITTGAATMLVRVDSCKATQMVDAYGNVKDGTSLAGLLGAKWWPVGVANGIAFAWAWNNQSKVKSCAVKGTGITFKEIGGTIASCHAQ